jgi:hypothetical protein
MQNSVHGVRAMLDLHPEWVELQMVNVQNTFNLVSWTTILKELQSSTNTLDQLFPFVHWFYTHQSPLYFSKASRHRDLIVISFEFGTWEGDPSGRMLFALVHFRTFHPTSTSHPTCVFPSLVDDMHIIGPTLDVLHVFIWLQKEFGALGFLMQLMKCVVWSP